MTRAQIAAKVRADKELHPERYCHAPECLWRVKHTGGPDTPCRKHGLQQIDMRMGERRTTLAPPDDIGEIPSDRRRDDRDPRVHHNPEE